MIQERTFSITSIEKSGTSGIVLFSGPNGIQNPQRIGTLFVARPTDIILISPSRQYIQVCPPGYCFQFGVSPTITIAGDPSSPYAMVGTDYSSTDYSDKLEEIYLYLVTSVFADCCCPDTTIISTPQFVSTEADLPVTGIENVLYVAKDQGTEWRWDGTAWRQLVVEDSAITSYNYRFFT